MWFDSISRTFVPTLTRGIIISVLYPILSSAATWTVVNTNDSGLGSLRSAISTAGSGDTINFNLTYPATITLTSGGLSLGQDLTITGPGSSNLTISGNSRFTVFTIATGAGVSISSVTIASGNANDSVGYYAAGGGIMNSGTLTLTNSKLSDNYASSFRISDGGGIFNTGTLTLTNSTVSGNAADGADFGGAGGGHLQHWEVDGGQ